MTIKGIPKGYHSATPRLVVRDWRAAIEFYKTAFGATDVNISAVGESLHYAEFKIGEARVMLAADRPEFGGRTAEAIGGTPVMIHVYVDDVDQFARKAASAGAKIARAVADAEHGDRNCTIFDPFGHRWMFATHQRNVSVEEMSRASSEWKIEGSDPSDDASATASQATPYLCADHAIEALEFYKRGFGARETMRFVDKDSRLGHATLRFGDSAIFLSDEYPGICSSPRTLGGTCVLIHVYVDDADALASRAIGAGAKVLIPISDQGFGDRSGRIQDPYGHIWTISTHIKDVSAEEAQKYSEEWEREHRKSST